MINEFITHIYSNRSGKMTFLLGKESAQSSQKYKIKSSFCKLCLQHLHSQPAYGRENCPSTERCKGCQESTQFGTLTNDIMHAYKENHLKILNFSQVTNFRRIAFQTLQHAVQKVIDPMQQSLLGTVRQRMSEVTMDSVCCSSLPQMLLQQDRSKHLRSWWPKYKAYPLIVSTLGLKQLLTQ